MEDLQVELVAYVSVIVAACGVIGAVVYYVYTLRNQAQMRKTDLIVRLFSTFISKDFQDAEAKVFGLDFQDYAEFKEKFGPYPSEQPIHIAIRTVASFFEALGILLKRNLIQMDLVQDLFSIRLRWEKLWPILRALREEFDESGFFISFEYLYDAEKKYRQSKGIP